MKVEEFINDNRNALVRIVGEICSNCSLGDDDLEEWISNDESLYNWAISEGVEDI